MQAFVDDMARLGLAPAEESGLVICHLAPVGGARAGSVVEVGVAIEEVANWPQAPPHWIHLPADIKFARTNSEPSPKPGWRKHSRNSAGWGDAPAAVCWAAHLQAVLDEAIR